MRQRHCFVIMLDAVIRDSINAAEHCSLMCATLAAAANAVG